MRLLPFALTSSTMLIFTEKKLHLRADACVTMAFVLLVVPARWIFAWLVATFVHEGFHYLALRVCNVRICCISAGFCGAKIETEYMTPGKEALCAAAGPVGSMLLILLIKWFPALAVCAAFQAAYNLLPVLPLDGGRVVSSFLSLMCSQKRKENICVVISYVVFAFLLLFSLVALYFRFGPVPLLFSVMLFIKNRQIKIPCKPREQIVQ